MGSHTTDWCSATAPGEDEGLTRCGRYRGVWPSLAGLSRHGKGARAILAHSAHSEEVVVGRDALEHRFSRRRHEVVHLPARVRGLAPKNLESRAVRIFAGGPCYLRVGRDA